MLLSEKYLYSSFAVQEERQIKWEIQYQQITQAKKIVELQKNGKIEGHRGFGALAISEWEEEKAKIAKEIPADWIESQKNRDKEKELLMNLAARNTWGLISE